MLFINDLSVIVESLSNQPTYLVYLIVVA